VLHSSRNALTHTRAPPSRLRPGVFQAAAYTTGDFDHPHDKPTRATLRIVNDHQEIDFYVRTPNQPWRRIPESAEISGMHHNILGGFLDVRPALSSWGTGNATFRNFRYSPQVTIPT
jgi:beta-xylosidase